MLFLKSICILMPSFKNAEKNLYFFILGAHGMRPSGDQN